MSWNIKLAENVPWNNKNGTDFGIFTATDVAHNHDIWCDPAYDRLFEELTQTTDDAARAALIKQLNDLLVQGYAEIPLVLRGFVSAHLDTLQGVRINGWDSELWNIAEWRR